MLKPNLGPVWRDSYSRLTHRDSRSAILGAFLLAVFVVGLTYLAGNGTHGKPSAMAPSTQPTPTIGSSAK